MKRFIEYAKSRKLIKAEKTGVFMYIDWEKDAPLTGRGWNCLSEIPDDAEGVFCTQDADIKAVRAANHIGAPFAIVK